MFWLTKRIDPSAKQPFTPPGWLLPAVTIPPVASALEEESPEPSQEGPFGGKTVLKPQTSAWPSVQIFPCVDLTITPMYDPLVTVPRQALGLLSTAGRL